MEHIRLLIIGSGPAGYTAAIYAARANNKPVIIEGMQPGGQLTQTTLVENYPGFPEGRMGLDLVTDMRTQAERLGTEIRFGTVVNTDFAARPMVVSLDDGTQLSADCVIIATGASARYLGLSAEEKYAGAGVSACATCDGFFYRGKEVAVVGGGDTAAEEALYLAGLAKKVYMIVRRDVLRAQAAMQQRVMENPKIEVLYNRQTVDLTGEGRVEHAVLRNSQTGETETIDIQGFFLAIGHKPNTEAFPQIETDAQGYIRVEAPFQRTNMPGVFACGDVCDPNYRQAITAAASGCRAAMDAEKYLISKN